MKYLRYLKHVLVHKAYVLKYSFRLGCVWRGIWHDMSKFSPTEFTAHAAWFFQKSFKDCCVTYAEAWEKHKTDGFDWEMARAHERLDRAWLHHLRRNPHHPEFWCIVQAGEGDKAEHVRTRKFRHVVIEMDEPYRKEMWADWLARSIHRDGNNLADWYETVGRHHPFGKETRAWVEEKLKGL